jgi:hypothetical protein
MATVVTASPCSIFYALQYMEDIAHQEIGLAAGQKLHAIDLGAAYPDSHVQAML